MKSMKKSVISETTYFSDENRLSYLLNSEIVRGLSNEKANVGDRPSFNSSQKPRLIELFDQVDDEKKIKIETDQDLKYLEKYSTDCHSLLLY